MVKLLGCPVLGFFLGFHYKFSTNVNSDGRNAMLTPLHLLKEDPKGKAVVLTSDTFEKETQAGTGMTTGDWFVSK